MKTGDWIFITGANRINQEFFDKNHPRGIFGRLITDNTNNKTELTARVYTRNGRSHLFTDKRFVVIATV